MNVLVTGCAGFVGSSICYQLRRLRPDWKINGLDNLSRVGSETNITGLVDVGVNVVRGDVRCQTDFELFSDVDYVIDAAANPSVLAGTSGSGCRQLIDQNLVGTINTLEFCRCMRAGLILLSSSRVYSIEELCRIPLKESDSRFLIAEGNAVSGLTTNGISEEFSTRPPISMYGVTKLTSEYLALEYSSSYGFPVWVNRCGVLSGEGQFGISSQGIVSFWIAMLMAGRDLVYTGQGGKGFQVRDLLHPIDLARLIVCQIEKPQTYGQLYNVSGGISSSFSLFELTEYCRKRGFGEGVRSSGDNRINDVPHVVLDSSKVENCLNWSPAITTTQIFDRVIKFMEENPNWLRVSGNLR